MKMICNGYMVIFKYYIFEILHDLMENRIFRDISEILKIYFLQLDEIFMNSELRKEILP